jgi:hypothetical protein
MAYRIYFFLDGHIRKVEELLDCSDDDAARDLAVARLVKPDGFTAIEVWDRARKVCALSSAEDRVHA